MRTTLTLAALALSVLPVSAVHADSFVSTVDSLYVRYVGHYPSPVVRHELVHRLRSGTPVIHIEAAILGSDDFYRHHGRNEVGFIRGMFVDVTGRPATQPEVAYWLNRLHRDGHSRVALAHQFLRETRYAPVVAPVVGYTPVGYTPLVGYTPAPVVVTPPVAPVYPVAPRSSFSFGLSIR